MEAFEARALEIAENPPRLWKRFVDDTFVVQQIEQKENFIQHINFIDQAIKFTVEDIWSDGSIPFLGTIITAEPNKIFYVSIYRKPTVQINIYSGTVITM